MEERRTGTGTISSTLRLMRIQYHVSTYITNHNNARALIRKVDRDELLQTLVKDYLLH